MPEVPSAGEDHGEVVAVGDFDGHLVADRAAGLDDRGDARLAAAWIPSGNGKYASDAMTESFARSPARRSAISTETWRLACAAPIPTVAAFLARTMAFERTWRTARQANSRSVSSSSVGRRFVTTWSCAAVEPEVVEASRRAGRRRRA